MRGIEQKGDLKEIKEALCGGIFNARQRDLILIGKCPYCEVYIKHFHKDKKITCLKIKKGICPETGHKKSCKHKDIRLE